MSNVGIDKCLIFGRLFQPPGLVLAPPPILSMTRGILYEVLRRLRQIISRSRSLFIIALAHRNR